MSSSFGICFSPTPKLTLFITTSNAEKPWNTMSHGPWDITFFRQIQLENVRSNPIGYDLIATTELYIIIAQWRKRFPAFGWEIFLARKYFRANFCTWPNMHPFFVCDQRQHLFASGYFLRTHFRRVRILGSFWPLSRTVRNVIWYWRCLDCFSRKSAIICVRYVKGSYPYLPRCSFQESPRWKWLKDLRAEIYSGSLLWVTFEWNDKMTCCNLKVKQIRCLAWPQC